MEPPTSNPSGPPATRPMIAPMKINSMGKGYQLTPDLSSGLASVTRAQELLRKQQDHSWRSRVESDVSYSTRVLQRLRDAIDARKQRREQIVVFAI